MLKIRLMRTGKTNRPFYRIVVQESGNKLNGNVKALLGTYDSIKGGAVKVDQVQVKHWVARGAKMSSTVAGLVKKAAKAESAA